MARSRHTSQVTRNLSLSHHPVCLPVCVSLMWWQRGPQRAPSWHHQPYWKEHYPPNSSEESSRTKSHRTDWFFTQPWSWEGRSATRKLCELRAQAGKIPKGNQGADTSNGNGKQQSVENGYTPPVKWARETDVKKQKQTKHRLPSVTPCWELLFYSALKDT